LSVEFINFSFEKRKFSRLLCLSILLFSFSPDLSSQVTVFLFFLFSFPGTYNSLHRELVVVEGACPLSSSSPPLSPVGAPTPPAARRNIILGTASTPL
jgi:hypothetical protein